MKNASLKSVLARHTRTTKPRLLSSGQGSQWGEHEPQTNEHITNGNTALPPKDAAWRTGAHWIGVLKQSLIRYEVPAFYVRSQVPCGLVFRIDSFENGRSFQKPFISRHLCSESYIPFVRKNECGAQSTQSRYPTDVGTAGGREAHSHEHQTI